VSVRAICRDEHSHYRVQTTKTAEELNSMYGASPAQARAMLGSHTPLADPGRYDADGKLLARPAGKVREKAGTGPDKG
jgi:hypothetical protein